MTKTVQIVKVNYERQSARRPFFTKILKMADDAGQAMALRVLEKYMRSRRQADD